MEKPDSPLLLLKSQQELSSWISSSIAIAALFGSLLCSFIVRFLGTRKTLISVGLPVTIGWLIIAFSRSFALVIIGRVITGLSIGVITTSAPPYVSDIVTPDTRGFLGSCFQLILCCGQLVMIGFGCFLEWYQLPWVGIIPTVMCSVGLFFLGVESPYELIEDGMEDYAKEVLTILRKPGSDIEEEIIELKLRAQQNAENAKLNSSPTANLSRADVWKPLVITMMLMFFQQFSGVNAVMFNLTGIFEASHFVSANVAALMVTIALVIATLVSGLLMDRFGRKFLLLISGAGHVVTLAIMGLYYSSIEPNATFLPVLMLMLFVVSFSLGYGPIPWMIAGEITPIEVKPMVSSIGSTTNWLCAFLTTKFFLSFQDIFKTYGVYWIFTVTSALSIGYVQFFVPETKQTTLRDIQNYFLNN